MEVPKHALGGYALRGRRQSPAHKAARLASAARSLASTTRVCVECSSEYTPTSPPQKFCSTRCYDTAARRRRAKRPTVYVEALERARMLVAQDGKCAICQELPSGRTGLAVDHNHETGVVRGLLCGRCNTAIGLLRDDPAVVQAALAYLQKS